MHLEMCCVCVSPPEGLPCRTSEWQGGGTDKQFVSGRGRNGCLPKSRCLEAAASWRDGPGEADRVLWSRGSCAGQVASWPAWDFLPGLEFWVLTLLSAASDSAAVSPRLCGCDPCSGPGQFPFLPPWFRMLRSSHFQMPSCSLFTSPSLSSPFLQG